MEAKSKKVRIFTFATLAVLKTRFEHLRTETYKKMGRSDRAVERLMAITKPIYDGLSAGIEQLAHKVNPSVDDILLYGQANELKNTISRATKRPLGQQQGGITMKEQQKESDVIVITDQQVTVARATLPPSHGAFFRMNCTGLIPVSQPYHLDRQCDLLAAFQLHIMNEHQNDAILVTRGADGGPAAKKCPLQDRPLCEGCNGYVAGYEEDVMRHGQVTLPVGPTVRHKPSVC